MAGGVVAAASAGGALMPPVMGAAAYMMLEMVTPAVTYIQIIRSALLPALLYYFSLLLLVHLYSRRYRLAEEKMEADANPAAPWAGVVFSTSLALLLIFLFLGLHALSGRNRFNSGGCRPEHPLEAHPSHPRRVDEGVSEVGPGGSSPDLRRPPAWALLSGS